MERVTDEDVVMQIGTQPSLLGEGDGERFGFLGPYVPGEASEVASDNPLVLVEIGPNTCIGVAHRVEREGYWGGHIVSSDANDLSFDLQNRKMMKIVTANGGVISVDFLRSDIRAGLARVRECQRETT